MDKKIKIFLITAVLSLITVFLLFRSINRTPPSTLVLTPTSSPTPDQKSQAIQKAQEVYRQAQQQNLDLSSGPCLSNNLIPDWVLDIAHNPRTSVDDQPENQCPAFRSGQAHHFVELDPDGNLIRTY